MRIHRQTYTECERGPAQCRFQSVVRLSLQHIHIDAHMQCYAHAACEIVREALTVPGVCSMLRDVCQRMLTYAEVC